MSLITNSSLPFRDWSMGWPKRTTPISEKEQMEIQNQFRAAVLEGNFYLAEHLLGTGMGRGAKIDGGDVPVLLNVICLSESIETKIKKLNFLRQHGANFNAANLHGMTALHLAAQKGDANLLAYLLNAKRHGAFRNLYEDLELSKQDAWGNTALHEIVKNPRLDPSMIDLWVDARGPIEIKNNKGETPLTLCCLIEDFEKANALLNRGDSSFFQLDEKGLSPFLISLIKCGETSATKKSAPKFENLLYSMLNTPNIDLEANIGLGLTPLLGVSKVPALEDLMSLLITKGANVNVKDPKSGNTALHNAARVGDEFYVLSLLNQVDNVDSVNNSGNTPLKEAFLRGHSEIVKILSTQTSSELEPIQEEEEEVIEGSPPKNITAK